MVFFVKKVDLSSTQGALCTVSVFFILHFTYLGDAYAPNARPPMPTCLVCLSVTSWSSSKRVEQIDSFGKQWRNLPNISRQSYDYLMITPKLRSTYDGRLVHQTSYEEHKAFLRHDSIAKS